MGEAEEEEIVHRGEIVKSLGYLVRVMHFTL